MYTLNILLKALSFGPPLLPGQTSTKGQVFIRQALFVKAAQMTSQRHPEFPHTPSVSSNGPSACPSLSLSLYLSLSLSHTHISFYQTLLTFLSSLMRTVAEKRCKMRNTKSYLSLTHNCHCLDQVPSISHTLSVTV